MRLVLGQTALSIPANFAIGNPDLLKGDGGARTPELSPSLRPMAKM